MHYSDLRLIQITHYLTERELGQQLGTTQQTVHRWLTHETSIPRGTQKLIDHEFGDGSSGSAANVAKAELQESWDKFVRACSAQELALVSVGMESVVMDFGTASMFRLTPHSEHGQELYVYWGDLCGAAHEPLELTAELLTKLGHEEIADEIHQLITDQDSEELGRILAPIVGNLERLEMLRHDIWSAAESAIINWMESEEISDDQVA